MNEIDLKVDVLKYLRDNPAEQNTIRTSLNPYLITCDLPLLKIRTVLNGLHEEKLAVILNYGELGSRSQGILHDFSNTNVLAHLTAKGSQWLINYERDLRLREEPVINPPQNAAPIKHAPEMHPKINWGSIVMLILTIIGTIVAILALFK